MELSVSSDISILEPIHNSNNMTLSVKGSEVDDSIFKDKTAFLHLCHTMHAALGN